MSSPILAFTNSAERGIKVRQKNAEVLYDSSLNGDVVILFDNLNENIIKDQEIGTW